jgi:cytochrome P450
MVAVDYGAFFDDPDTLRLDREAKPHLAFGRGVHFCLGAALGRLEGQVIIPSEKPRPSAFR